ncbi:MAG: type II toxin-antitoxin system YafQ family toxin [Coxiellaceae bacterium]|nr:type II toxin-antitoxin system YafQ family toxin [Coxiellaceae bacterium]
MLKPVYTKSFEKDIKRVKRRNKNMDKLKLVIKLLLHQENLPPRCHDHSLSGNYALHRECHIEPDWLLIYQIAQDSLRLERTGSHADLFK